MGAVGDAEGGGGADGGGALLAGRGATYQLQGQERAHTACQQRRTVRRQISGALVRKTKRRREKIIAQSVARQTPQSVKTAAGGAGLKNARRCFFTNSKASDKAARQWTRPSPPPPPAKPGFWRRLKSSATSTSAILSPFGRNWRGWAMLIIPAIDLLDGRCVRLREGDYATAQVFEDDPAAAARRFFSLGARRLHVVDLGRRQKRTARKMSPPSPPFFRPPRTMTPKCKLAAACGLWRRLGRRWRTGRRLQLQAPPRRGSRIFCGGRRKHFRGG